MSLDHDTLSKLRESHPAWRLLCASHAPLIASFLDRAFIEKNVRVMAQSELAEKLEDELFALRERGLDFPQSKSALDYLNDWAANDKAWLRKFYMKGSDEPHFDLTPATEKAVSWLKSLAERSFVGTESKLLTLFQLLKQIVEGTDSDVQNRILELTKRMAEIESEIGRISTGNLDLLTDTAVKDRFQQFSYLAREILSDFREVEHNFRGLDRKVREKIALYSGSKGNLLAEIIGDRDEITESDQGRSFQAFWSFLMSRSKQEELSTLLDTALALPAVAQLQPDTRLSRIHYDWLEAGEHTQSTVRLLSQQLRRFLDDTVWLENRRIIEILSSIEQRAIQIRDVKKDDFTMEISIAVAEIDLPMERRLYAPPIKPRFQNVALEYGDNKTINASALFEISVVDRAALERHIRKALQEHSQVPLSKLVETRPLEHGLAELMVYFQLATDKTFKSVINEESIESITLSKVDEAERIAWLPQVIFVR